MNRGAAGRKTASRGLGMDSVGKQNETLPNPGVIKKFYRLITRRRRSLGFSERNFRMALIGVRQSTSTVDEERLKMQRRGIMRHTK